MLLSLSLSLSLSLLRALSRMWCSSQVFTTDQRGIEVFSSVEGPIGSPTLAKFPARAEQREKGDTNLNRILKALLAKEDLETEVEVEEEEDEEDEEVEEAGMDQDEMEVDEKAADEGRAAEAPTTDQKEASNKVPSGLVLRLLLRTC
jgi:hypothetical protein